jgi:hypothetical protein
VGFSPFLKKAKNVFKISMMIYLCKYRRRFGFRKDPMNVDVGLRFDQPTLGLTGIGE